MRQCVYGDKAGCFTCAMGDKDSATYCDKCREGYKNRCSATFFAHEIPDNPNCRVCRWVKPAEARSE